MSRTVAGSSPLNDEARFNPEIAEVQQAAASVLNSLKESRNARIALYDSGYALIDLCYPSLRILARHHASIYEILEDDLDSLTMKDFPPEILGRGFKTALLSSITALPGTKKL